MPVPNEKIQTNNHKKQKRWSLIGILSKKKKCKKSQESVDFCPYDGKINQKVAYSSHLDYSSDCPIEQYTCSPRLIRRCNSLQYTSQVSAYSNTTKQHKLNEWKSSQQSVQSSSSSTYYSDIGVYKSCDNSYKSSSYYIKEENEQTTPVLKNIPYRCSSDIGYYQNKMYYNQKYSKSFSMNPNKLIGKKIPPPPPPRDPNIKAVYYFRNNKLMSRESDSTYFSQDSNDNIPDENKIYENLNECRNEYCIKEPPRSRRPIQICDVETLSTESKNSIPKIQSVEEAIQELEDIYNSLGLSDEDLLDRAERRDLPTLHQNMRYQSFDELDYINHKRLLPKTQRSGMPDIVSDDMAYRRLNKKESKRQSFIPGSFLLVLPTVYNIDKNSKQSGEPDITLDDVVFRSRRQQLNFLKTPDPQPPFGIPLGPIVGAAPSDYLHAVPEGRYKSSFHPRKIPDTVEDDLAFRTLRKENKYKTCIDFSLIHRNHCKIDNLIPKLSSNNIKNDTHWIIKKSLADYSKHKNQVDLITDDVHNLMIVKIDHHKPIVLSGFSLSEANVLSKSFFRSNVLKHESCESCLTNSTHTLNSCAPRLPNHPLNALNEQNMNALPVAIKHSKSLNRAKYVPEKGNKSMYSYVQFTNVDNDDLVYKGVNSINQPNFRELIKREYSHKYPLSKYQSNFIQGDHCTRAPTSSYKYRSRDEIKYRFTNNVDPSTTVDSTINVTDAVDKPKDEDTFYAGRLLPSTTSLANAAENRTEPISFTGMNNGDSSSSSTSNGANVVPGYLEDGRDVT